MNSVTVSLKAFGMGIEPQKNKTRNIKEQENPKRGWGIKIVILKCAWTLLLYDGIGLYGWGVLLGL